VQARRAEASRDIYQRALTAAGSPAKTTVEPV